MKHTLRNRTLLFGSTLFLGLFSFYLHETMVRRFLDAKGLLIPGSLPEKLLWAAGAAMALILWRAVKNIGGDGSYAGNFPRSFFSGALSLAAGATLFGVVMETAYPSALQHWLGLAAACAMAVAGVLRMAGKRPYWPLHGIVCLFFILTLIGNYQRFSADPQIHEYAYPLLAGILLMLAAFHRTCCDARILQRKKLIRTCFAAAFCCLASLGTAEMPRFYLAGALWAFGSVCDVSVFPPDPEPEIPAEETLPEAGEE